MTNQSTFTQDQISTADTMQFSTHLYKNGAKISGNILRMTETTVTLSLLNGRSKRKFDINDLDIFYIS